MAGASKQEDVVETLMAHSFGAQFLCRPELYLRPNGWKREEPADLAWIQGEFVALFYMTSSERPSLSKQISHNRKQARRYARLWATGQPNFTLVAKNRFGDVIEKSFRDVQYLVTISIVSAQCGVQLHFDSTFGKKGFTLVIPEDVLHGIAEHGGTLTDLLLLASTDLNFPRRGNLSQAEEFVRLKSIQAAIEARAWRDGAGLIEAGQPLPTLDELAAVLEPLANCKCAPSSPASSLERSGRELLASTFGDLVYSQYISLGCHVHEVLRRSEAPAFNKYVIARLTGQHHDFVVFSFHAGAKQFERAVDGAITAATERELGNGRPCLMIGYGYIGLEGDHRWPVFLGIPKQTEQYKSQAASIADQILAMF